MFKYRPCTTRAATNWLQSSERQIETHVNHKSSGHPDSLSSLWRDSSAQAVGVMLLAGLGFSYAHVLKAIVAQWWTNNLYSYGFLIPPISLYLIWLHRDTIQLLQPRPNCM